MAKVQTHAQLQQHNRILILDLIAFFCKEGLVMIYLHYLFQVISNQFSYLLTKQPTHPSMQHILGAHIL